MLIILALGAVFTSIVSGIIGMGGGVLLLSIMSFFMVYETLIPVHGIVQLVSNSSRSYYLRKDIKLSFLIPFLFGSPFGFIVAYYLIKSINTPNIYYLFLGLFVTYVVFKPKRMPSFKLKPYQWGLLGFFSAIQGSLIGATGPLIAPFFVRDDLSKEQIVATKAAQQILTHALKIPLFLTLGFDYTENINLIIILSLAAVLGTLIGVKILKKVDEQIFKLIFKIMLTLSALRMYYKFYLGF